MFLLQFFVSGICKDIAIASLGEDIPKKLLEAGRTSLPHSLFLSGLQSLTTYDFVFILKQPILIKVIKCMLF